MGDFSKIGPLGLLDSGQTHTKSELLLLFRGPNVLCTSFTVNSQYKHVIQHPMRAENGAPMMLERPLFALDQKTGRRHNEMESLTNTFIPSFKIEGQGQ